MKFNKLLTLIVVAGSFGLIGCKPHTVTWQMFIVTRGAENVKLGGVQVIVFEKRQVTEFLRKTQADIDTGIKTRKQEMADALRDVEAAQANADTTAQNLETAIARSHSNGEYIRIQAQKDALSRTNNAVWEMIKPLQGKIEALGIGWFRESNLQRNYNPFAEGDFIKSNLAILKADGDDLSRLGPLLIQMDRTLRGFRPEAEQELAQKLNDIEQQAKGEARAKFDAAQSALNALRSKATNIQNLLDEFPTANDYLQGMLAGFKAANSTQTDADGRFSITCPHGGQFTVYATAQRTVPTESGTRTETYYWLVDIPSPADNGQFFLNNNNTTAIDPSGYFQVKPHQDP